MMRMGRVVLPSGKLAADALYEYALRALARRSHTVTELEGKLQRRSASESDVASVVEKLRAHGYLNDARVAEAHSVIRRDLNVVGPRRVLSELKRRGVAGQTAEDAVADAYDGCDEANMARAHLRRKLGTPPGDASVRNPKDLARLYRSLARAGFRRSAIADVLREVAADAEWADALVEEDSADEYGE